MGMLTYVMFFDLVINGNIDFDHFQPRKKWTDAL